MFGRDKRPALTKEAEKLSALLNGLDDIGRAKAAATIADIVSGIGNLSALPEDLIQCMWSMLITIARKTIVGGEGSELMGQIEAGLDPAVLKLIKDSSASRRS